MTTLYWGRLRENIVIDDEAIEALRLAVEHANRIFFGTDLINPSHWGISGCWQDMEDPNWILWPAQFASFPDFLENARESRVTETTEPIDHIIQFSIREFVETKAFALDPIEEPDHISTLDSPCLVIARIAIAESSKAEFNDSWENTAAWIIKEHMKPYTFRSGWAVGLLNKEEGLANWYAIGGCASPAIYPEFQNSRHYDKYTDALESLILEEEVRFYHRLV